MSVDTSLATPNPLVPVFTDTHCHIHDPEFFPGGGDEPYELAKKAGVGRMLCVGTSIQSSKEAVQFCIDKDGAYAVVGVHPHDAEKDFAAIGDFFTWGQAHRDEKLVGVGEIGLDYYYDNSPRRLQVEILEKQIEFAVSLGLPISFHVRNAFEDFWPLLDNFRDVQGVLHSFTDSLENMEKGLERGLYIGINGIATFARDRDPITKAAPVEKILLETDAPFLTPVPLRGKINVPGNVPLIASHVAALRGITVEELSQETEQNVTRLFF